MKILREGQCISHTLYGVGIATEANQDRTTIDFYEHGIKKFVTPLFEAELVAQAPARPGKPRAAAGAKKAKKG